MKTKSLMTSLAISIVLIGSASAKDLATMDGIPAEAMSHAQMDKVQGKMQLLLPGYGMYNTVNQAIGMNGVYASFQLLNDNYLRTNFQNTRQLAFNPMQQLSWYSPSQANALIAAVDRQYGSLFNLGCQFTSFC